jgi:biopolymer transport protein ExbD
MEETRDTEKLVEQAFRGIAPDPGIEEELLDSLPDERAEPRGPIVWKVLWPVAAAAAIAAAFFWPRTEGVEETAVQDQEPPEELIEEPDPLKTVWPKAQTDAASVDVRLAEGGRVLIQPEALGGEWAQVSLDGLAGYLQTRAEAYDARMRKHGKRGYENHGSRLNVVIHGDKQTPWRHIQWVMLVCAEKRMPRLQFRNAAEQVVDAALPIDLGIRPPGEEPAVEIRVAVQMLPGPIYRFGHSQETRDLAVVGKWIAYAKKAAAGEKAELMGEIKAGATVKHRHVVALLDEFHKRGIKEVQFYGTALPDGKIREALKLPDPASPRKAR